MLSGKANKKLLTGKEDGNLDFQRSNKGQLPRKSYRNAVAFAYSVAVGCVVLQAVLETSIFSRRADALLSRDERADLINALAREPLAGDVVPGLGGVRKLRFAPKGRGKSGAFRVIYYVLTQERPVLALLIYGKNEQVNPTPEQTRAIMIVVAAFKAGPE